MLNNRIKTALIVLAASAGLGACTNFGPYGGVGVGVGYGSPYGYGYGSGYGSPYYGNYYGGYPYFGWYDGFYYPGAGYWVYDPYGHRFPINERQSHYWSNMLEKFRHARGAESTAAVKENFAGFRAKARAGATIPGVDLNAAAQAEQRSLRQMQVERQQQLRSARQEEQSQRAQARSERQDSLRPQVQEHRAARRRGKSDD